jgi:Tn3 transposase DDE domain
MLRQGRGAAGREFGDQLHTFSCLPVLHNAVVAWNMVHIEPVVEQLRAEGQRCDDELLSLTTPLLRRHPNPFWPLLLRFGADAP